MTNKLVFVAFYQKSNKYSFNALLGALETEEALKDIDTILIREEEELLNNLENIIYKSETVILGISFFTTQIWETNKLINSLRAKYNQLIIIAGGPHPTGDPTRTLKMGFDLVVVGEGEETFVELMRCFNEGGDYKNVKGLAYLNDNNDYIYTGKRGPIDLNNYPPFPVKKPIYAPIEISRGCPYTCYFCQTPYIHGVHPRHRSIASISKYIKIMKGYDKTDIRFISPNAFSYGSEDGKELNLPEIEQLLIKTREILGSKGRIFFGSFPSEVRPEHITKETLALITNYCANDNIVIGAQSGSQKILDSCHRGHSVEDIYVAAEITIESKLVANIDFIFGLPDETEDDINSTISVMKDLANIGARIHAHSFLPLPQTPFARKPLRKMNNELKNIVYELNSKGILYGDWKKQEKLANKIASYLKTGEIKNKD